jgi:Ca-activated chloride channel family protein
VLEGKVGTESKRFEFPVELAREGDGGSYKFVETLWAVRRVGYLIDQIDLHGQNKELTDELVELSKTYGILTPYTSFLADERVNLNLRADLGRRANEQLSQLHESQGASGVAQRAAKGRMLNAGSGDSNGQYYALEAKRQAGAMPAGAANGGLRAGGGLGGFGPATSRPALPGLAPATDAASLAAKPAANAAVVYAEDAEGRVQVAENVRRVGSKTFFKRGERWVDATVTAEQEKHAQTLEQFSDGYFELARKQTAELNQYLTFEEPVTVNLGSQTFKIDRPKRP